MVFVVSFRVPPMSVSQMPWSFACQINLLAFKVSDGDLSLCMGRLLLSMKAREVYFVLVLIEGCSNQNAPLISFQSIYLFFV